MKTSTANLVYGPRADAAHVQPATETFATSAVIAENETTLRAIVTRNVAAQSSVDAQKKAATKRASKAKAKVEAMQRRAALYGAGVVRKALDGQLAAGEAQVSAQSVATAALKAFIENGAKDVEHNGFVSVANALYADPTLRDDEGKTGKDSECKRQYMLLGDLLRRANKALSSGDNPVVAEGTRWAFNGKTTRALTLKGVAAKRQHTPENYLSDYRAAAKESDGAQCPATDEAIAGLLGALEVLMYEQTGEHVAVKFAPVAVTKADAKMVGPHDLTK